LSHITLERQRVSPKLFGDFFRDSLDLLECARRDGNGRAFTREGDGNRAPNAAAAAGDERESIL
jgi:hypothetical protein